MRPWPLPRLREEWTHEAMRDLSAQPNVHAVADAPALESGIVLQQRHDAIRHAFTDVGLLSRTVAEHEQRLAADPDDTETLRQMGDLQRKLGDFGAASETYRKLKTVDAWWIGALDGEELPASAPEKLHPAPFVRVPDFLTAAQQSLLLDAVRRGREHFVPARVRGTKDKGSVDLDTRVALVAERPLRRQIRPWFVNELGRVVGDVFKHFGIHDIGKSRVEFDLTAHRGGGFYRPHRDTDHARSGGRLVSFAYYFHREPKGFEGGELLLYDTCTATDDYRATSFSRIEPLNNSLVLFPSDYYHEVLPVRAKSDAFENARFTVNGWLHRARERQPVGRGQSGFASKRSREYKGERCARLIPPSSVAQHGEDARMRA